MAEMFRTEIGRLRLAGLIEGASFLILLFVAMPLKYFAGKPEVVSIVGLAHGVLFLLFCLALLAAWIETKWPIWRTALIFLCALFPFGPFLIDASLRREEERREAN
jgi:integral membrane protein